MHTTVTTDGIEVYQHNLVWVLETDAKGQAVEARMVLRSAVPDGTDCYAMRENVIAAAERTQAEFWRNFNPATPTT